MFYRDIQYQGERIVIDRDVPNLAALRLNSASGNWNRQISSLEIQDARNSARRRRW
jgi:hypothetical protein